MEERRYSKRKRRDTQPIKAELADLLRPWPSSKPVGVPVCPLPAGKAALLLRADMEAARAEWIAEAKNSKERTGREESDFLRYIDGAGRVADFHGLRVHYVSRVVEAGANAKKAMELARHSDPKLTFKIYARVGLHKLGRVLEAMPTAGAAEQPEQEDLAATGTDDSAQGLSNHPPQKPPHSARETARLSAASRGEPSAGARTIGGGKRLKIGEWGIAARNGAAVCENAPEGLEHRLP